ncbi:MAG TPA: hypothetical protein VKM35_00245 [Arenimonas sp.]|uniref:hypothetical protein n=1 Tax=Arenimonas sp. TaxID=1872635 RepID=UPI002D1CC258|nr:hypothetical protein [Arenimonas sp.]HMB55620.1 hypothetical protein [Arenimonas sp.]
MVSSLAGKFTRRGISVLLSALLLSTAAFAQSNNSGAITGHGEHGDTVIIRGTDTGFHREIQVPDGGTYRVRQVPIGSYNVILKHADGTYGTNSQVTISVGSTARVQ